MSGTFPEPTPAVTRYPSLLRILILTTKYSSLEESPSLADELAEAFGRQGHVVAVVNLRWEGVHGGNRTFRKNGVDVLEVSPALGGRRPNLFNRLGKWSLSSYLAAGSADQVFGDRKFDFVLAFAPAVTLAGLLSWARKRFRGVESYLHVADMFPYAHRDLGLVPRGTVFQAALWAETRLMRRFDMIGCMSPANARYLTTQYRLHPKTKVQILPIWGPTDSTGTVDARAVRARHGLPFDRPICIFGGQLSEGRGIEEILATAVLARQAANEIAFVIIGEGRLRPKVERHIASGGDNVFLLGRVPREAYLELAAACDVGLVVTVAHTDVPTFPSRTIDYLRAGLPIVASVERTTDYGMFIADHQLGIAIEAGHPDQLLSAIQHTFREDLDRAVIRRRAKAALDTVFDVDNVARKMVDQMTGKRSDASMP